MFIPRVKKVKAQNEVRLKSSLFYISITILLVIAIIMILAHQTSSIIIPLIVCVFMVLTYFNEKMIYDDSGITLINMLGRKFFISWDDVIAVENTIEDPRLTRGMPGMILKITYITKHGKTEIAKFDHTSQSGLYEFMVFYWCTVQKSNQK